MARRGPLVDHFRDPERAWECIRHLPQMSRGFSCGRCRFQLFDCSSVLSPDAAVRWRSDLAIGTCLLRASGTHLHLLHVSPSGWPASASHRWAHSVGFVFFECSDEKRGVVRPRVYLVGRRIQMSKTRNTNRTSPQQSTLKTRHRNGYAEFFDEKTQRWESTHRRTLAKRIGEDSLDGMQVHHIDGNKLNNTPHNLVALTPRMHGRVESVPTACFKCGRTSHWAKDCVAATDYKGTPLTSRRR
mgnify:CR=1 FL=1